MPLPASGAISINDVNVELGLSGTTTTTMNDTAVRNLLGQSTGSVDMNTAHSKWSIALSVAPGWYNPCYSLDGQTWIQSNWPSGLNFVNPSQPYQWQVLCYGNRKYVAATSGSYPNTKIAYSNDGATWIASGASPINAAFTCGAYGAGVYVFAANQGGANMITSTDAVNWTSRTVSGVGAGWSYMKFANGLFVMTAGHTNQARSTDGINWTLYTYTRVRGPTDYGNGMWLQLSAANPDGTCYYYTSTDNCATWTERIGPVTRDRVGPYISPGGFNGVIYGGGKWVLFSGPYQSAYSTDGINWTVFYLPVGNWNYGTYSSRLGLFIITGPSGTTTINGTVYTNNRCVTSPDGINWTTRTIPTTAQNGAGPHSVSGL